MGEMRNEYRICFGKTGRDYSEDRDVKLESEVTLISDE
jgi:hypothetical protein